MALQMAKNTSACCVLTVRSAVNVIVLPLLVDWCLIIKSSVQYLIRFRSTQFDHVQPNHALSAPYPSCFRGCK